MNSLFITNKNDLKANILGGVQLCTQEFLEVIRLVCNSVQIFEVDVAKDLKYRFIRKIGLDYYHLYNVKQYKINLLQFIQNNEINTVFINKAELMRFSKIIKDAFGNKVKVVLMSHGNETGDFLHQLSH
ncbi:MAG: hypothetical protein EAZ15_07130 [Sphingobacteriales bacterium]|nr:MAG: hypothetical protein EAZ15_07130 [Sphingobacteriales bacterium]